MKIEQLSDAVTVYCGDCRDVLPILGKVDAVITDPPYANRTHYGETIFSDTELALEWLIRVFMPWALANAKRTLVTPGNGNQALYPRPDWTLAWVVPAGVGRGSWGFTCWQPVLAYGSCPYLAAGMGCRPDIFIHTESAEENGHPCPKPIKFMMKLVERASLAGETILDPFMGSGTTGVAATKLGRKFIGIELEPKYFDIACKRIADASKQPDLFIEPPLKQLEMI